MTWPWVNAIITVLYYISLPIITIISWLLFPLTPLFHLSSYILHALYLPIQFLAKFESLYIYFTTAALIGLLSGTILHRTSRLLNSIVDLQTPATTKLELVSHKVARKKSWHEESESQNMKLRSLPPSKRDIDRAHREYWESASDKRRGRGNLLARQEVILEEDDSDDIF